LAAKFICINRISMRSFLLPVFLLFCTNGFSQSFIARQQAIGDIDFFTKTLEEVHFNPWLFIKKEAYTVAVEKLKNQMGDSISMNDFIIALYHITSLLKDSHTSPGIIQPLLKDEFVKEQFFPCKMIIDSNMIYVPKSSAVVSGLPVGAVIESINGLELSPLMRQINNYYGGGNGFAREMSTKLLSYFFFLHNIKAPFKIVYADSSGAKKSQTMEKGLTLVNALLVTMPNIKKAYSFSILDNKIGYFNFMAMSGTVNELDHYVDSCITLMKNKNIPVLAVDLRQNSGGNSVLGDLLISYFNTGKYTLMGGRKWKISQQYKNYLTENGSQGNEYLKKENGSVWEFGNCNGQKPRFKTNNLYKGKVYFLTSPFTFSSANMIADGIKQYKMAEIIGEPTGENTNDFGEVYVFTLPNSNIKMQTTTSFDFGADCNKNIYKPVMPDVLIRPTLAEKINEVDKAMVYLLSKY
jgi:hypothetical protein